MIVIHDKEKIRQCCDRFDISSHFSNWDCLEKKLVHYSKGEIIVMYGQSSDKLFILVSGKVKFYCIADNYEEYFFFSAKNEGLFGEVEYALGIPSISQSEVVEDCECIIIPIEKNRQYLDNDLKFQTFVAQILARKYNDLRSNYVDVEAFSLEERLARYLVGLKEQEEIGNLRQISKVMRCSYRQLLRIISKFCEAGYLERMQTKGKYRIANVDALKKMAGKGD